MATSFAGSMPSLALKRTTCSTAADIAEVAAGVRVSAEGAAVEKARKRRGCLAGERGRETTGGEITGDREEAEKSIDSEGVKMLLCPKTASTLLRAQLPISPIKSMLFSASSGSAVIAPPVVSLPRSPARQPRLFRAFSTAAPSAETPTPAATSAMSAAVEHVVLFKAKDGIDPAKVVAMLSNLRSLSALDGVLHLTAAAVLCHRSAAASALGFTHLLHSRYRTKEDLAAYSGHPTHVAVVREHVLPICDDIMAVDWVGELSSGPVAPPPGSAARVTLAKLTETAGEAGKVEVLRALGEFGESVPGAMEQLTYGENFSPARAKGYSVGSIAVFSSEEQLEGLGAKWGDQMEAQKEKVRPLLESVIVVDFVVPPPVAASGL